FPPRYLAILDGGGERYAQQFKLAEICDCLCVIIDHNKSDSDAAIDAARLAEHEVFLSQIRHHLDEAKAPQKSWTHFLINKSDLWASAAAGQQAKLKKLCDDEVQRWEQGRRAKQVDFRKHSNNNSSDVA